MRPADDAGDCDGTLSAEEAAAVAGEASTSGSASALDTVGVLGMMAGGLVLLGIGGAIGGVAGYRKATVDYRE